MSYYSIYATKRSGHHAFIEWLCHGLDGSWLYLNNLHLVDGVVCFSSAELSSNKKIKPGSVRETLDACGDSFDHIVFSYENITQDDLTDIMERGGEHRSTSGSGGHKKIVFLRDFFNSYASQFSWFEKNNKEVNTKSIDRFRKSWKFLAKNFVSGFSGSKGPIGDDVVTLSFDKFSFDDGYRDTIAKELGVDNNLLRQDLSKFGGGGNTFFSNPKSYEVDQKSLESRWELVDNAELFVDSIDDESLVLAKEFADKISRPELYLEPYRKLFS